VAELDFAPGAQDLTLQFAGRHPGGQSFGSQFTFAEPAFVQTTWQLAFSGVEVVVDSIFCSAGAAVKSGKYAAVASVFAVLVQGCWQDFFTSVSVDEVCA
jgi:hypothetical protein